MCAGGGVRSRRMAARDRAAAKASSWAVNTPARKRHVGVADSCERAALDSRNRAPARRARKEARAMPVAVRFIITLHHRSNLAYDGAHEGNRGPRPRGAARCRHRAGSVARTAAHHVAGPQTYTGCRAVDGDTLAWQQGRVRLRGVDTPERGQSGYRPAQQELQRRMGAAGSPSRPHHRGSLWPGRGRCSGARWTEYRPVNGSGRLVKASAALDAEVWASLRAGLSCSNWRPERLPTTQSSPSAEVARSAMSPVRHGAPGRHQRPYRGAGSPDG